MKSKDFLFKLVSVLALLIVLSGLFILLYQVFRQGFGRLSFDFLTSFPSRSPDRAGIYSAILGTLWVMGLTALMSIPLGVASALFLEEYDMPIWLKNLIDWNIKNLSGVPSIVYGILGLALFVRWFSLDRSILAGAMTMTLLILPIIMITSAEAIRAVPSSLRAAAYGVGATRRQVIFYHILPAALPGMITAILLALSRAIGESAPLILIGALSFVAFAPGSWWDSFTVLAIQVFNWAGRPQEAFQEIAAAGMIVLLALTLGLNALGIYLRIRFRGQNEE